MATKFSRLISHENCTLFRLTAPFKTKHTHTIHPPQNKYSSKIQNNAISYNNSRYTVTPSEVAKNFKTCTTYRQDIIYSSSNA